MEKNKYDENIPWVFALNVVHASDLVGLRQFLANMKI